MLFLYSLFTGWFRSQTFLAAWKIAEYYSRLLSVDESFYEDF